MRIHSLSISNFRGYRKRVSIPFNNLTAFVGKNDIGKSTLLEAMDIFFNDGRGSVRIDKNDVNIQEARTGNFDTEIAITFDDLPEQIVIDVSSATSLSAEYLVNEDKCLEVVKRYHNGGNPKVFIRAMHPQNTLCQDLLQKKNNELKAIVRENGFECEDLSNNAALRKAIWDHHLSDLQLMKTEIDVSKEDAKRIWDKVSNYLPIYTLFQSDRKNSDSDSEVQDPLQAAVRQIINDPELQVTLSRVADIVIDKLKEVSKRTLSKIQEMDSSVANSLTPVIPESGELKWADVFKKVSISGDDGIPINKRGSGIKRLVLLNFFRAEAERKCSENDRTGVIYAIEEPETSQHVANQRLLIDALLTVSRMPHSQVVITTHSGVMVKELAFENIRVVSEKEGEKKVSAVIPRTLKYPSLNEINYSAFGELSEEYHNELFGFIEFQNWLDEYKQGKKLYPYVRIDRKKVVHNEQLILSHKIRHQIHHPENTLNTRFSQEELRESIEQMRQFILMKAKAEGLWDPIEE